MVTPDPDAEYVDPILDTCVAAEFVVNWNEDVILCVISANAGLLNPATIIKGINFFIFTLRDLVLYLFSNKQKYQKLLILKVPLDKT